jgi:hypothetical protein
VLLIVVIPPEIVTTMVENPTINEESKGEAEVVEAALEEVAIIAVSLDTFLENVLTKRAVVVVIEVAVAAVEERVDRAQAAVLLVDVLTAEKMGTFQENALTKRTVVEIGAAAADQVVESVQKEAAEVVAGVITAAKKGTFPGNAPLSDPEEEEAAGEEVIDRVGVVEIERGVILVEIPVIFQETVQLLVRSEIRLLSCVCD